VGSSRRITVALVGLVLLVLAGWLVRAELVEEPPARSDGMPVRVLSELPAEVTDTWRLVENDGPFPYPANDGTVFRNQEGLLPDRDRGYYHEFTVPTRGSDDRGARRLVTGAGDEVYYTADHYESFVRVDVTR
jgi:guanyl-specific ribonuclease Sa